MGYNPIIYFNVPVPQDLASGSPLKWASVSFWLVPMILWEFPYILAKQDVLDHAGCFLTQHWNPKEFWFLLVESGI